MWYALFMSLYLHKSHNVSCLIYHIVCPTKYRRIVISERVDQTIKETCLEIAKRYDMHFLEIGTDQDHVHFLVQSVPMMLPKAIVQTIKSIVGRMVFEKHPEVKEQLWGGSFWTSGYFVNTVSRHGSESVIATYVKNQGIEGYTKLYDNQLTLFNDVA
jgi:REP element-mobilizing transposase RayT